MTFADMGGQVIDETTLSFLSEERSKALSTREWKFRLAGYGYAIKDVAGARMVTKLPQGTELGLLPAQFH